MSDTARERNGPGPPARELALLVACIWLPLLPFVPGAISIDGPVFVEVAQQILEDPSDPYGFEMIWDPTSPRAAVFNRNPPLLSYYLAPFIALSGESDAVMHAALLPFPLLAAFALYGIGRRSCGDGLMSALLLASTPAFLVLATTLMLDVPTLACWLWAVYALLRASQSQRAGWEWAAGCFAAAAGLMKYVGFCSAPLLAAGVLLLSPQAGLRKIAPLLRVVGVPLGVWALWGAYTHALYGEVHFLGSSDVITDAKKWQADQFWNHVTTSLIYIGAALVFPIGLWARTLLRGKKGIELAIVGVLLGTLVARYVLPDGEPPRRVELDVEGSVLAALGFAGGFLLCLRGLRPSVWTGEPIDRFLGLWLAGTIFFSMFVNWHVNAADALLAAPPLLLLLFRDPDLRPPRPVCVALVAIGLPLSFGLAWADIGQANTYREAARNIASEIGNQAGARYFVGQWGLQHYLAREGFEAIVPPMYGRTDLEPGDWIATARNVAQLDVSQNLDEYQMRQVWSRTFRSWLPLRTTNADAGVGFYSHHAGYVPWGWSNQPVEHLQLGRVGRRK